MPRVSIGDAEIYYEEAGQGEPLLLVPGLSGQGSFWSRQVEAFMMAFDSNLKPIVGQQATRLFNSRGSIALVTQEISLFLRRRGKFR